jgi:uncharacterized protein (DUF1697 family)
VRYAVFLRAINVGTTNRVRMETLRGWCAEMDFPGTRTHLQTGNLLIESDLDAASVARVIDQGLLAKGLKNATCIVRTKGELAEFVADCPWEAYPAAEYRQWVLFFREPIAAEARERFAALPQVALVREREVLTVTPIGAARASDTAMTQVAKLVKSPGTARFWGVVRDVLGLMD